MLILIVNILLILNISEAFVPAKLIEYGISSFDKRFDFGRASDTLTHEEIIKRGVIQAVVRYFYNQTDGPSKIDLSKINNEYYNLRNLYYDYYGARLCSIDLADLIQVKLQANVALVDFAKTTKDLPYAHFDSETMYQSNTRVISMKKRIYESLQNKDYTTALQLSGQVLHTIHDFYSHSNWVEMGNIDRLNLAIGTDAFYLLPVTNSSDKITCGSNCTYTEITCNSLVSLFSSLINEIGMKTAVLKCPLKYYRCSQNIAVSDKLVSGYYSGQKLDDGTDVVKPATDYKCSHGGILDQSSDIPAVGGINKDSGYYIFSPHANLHLIAAQLAINHTEYFFNEIRENIGNEEFANFLKIKKTGGLINTLNNYVAICSSSMLKSNLFLLVTVALCFKLNIIFF